MRYTCIEKNHKITTCNRLDLETLGFDEMCPKIPYDSMIIVIADMAFVSLVAFRWSGVIQILVCNYSESSSWSSSQA